MSGIEKIKVDDKFKENGVLEVLPLVVDRRFPIAFYAYRAQLVFRGRGPVDCELFRLA